MEKYINTEVCIDVELEDVLDFIETEKLNKNEEKQIKDVFLKRFKTMDLGITNLYDQEKFELVMELMKNCNLEQLEEIVKKYIKI